MRREDLADMAAFMAVADERSFTRAAVRLGLSQSALSQTIKALENRLGIRLLARNTRSVAPTQAGERLLARVRPAIQGIALELESLAELRDEPSGLIRITTGKGAADTILSPALARFLPKHPGIRVEVVVDPALTDIVEQRYDAGIRMGERLARDMIAVRVGPDLSAAVVASPGYFRHRIPPKSPRQLVDHDCLAFRLQATSALSLWEFNKGTRKLDMRPEPRIAFNDVGMMIDAAIAGLGIAYVTEDLVREAIADGRLIRVLSDWCPPFPGYHLYYPSRRQPTRAFALLVEALRYRG